MKKILFVIAALITMSFASCGNSMKSSVDGNDSVMVEDTVGVDTVISVDSADTVLVL